jgi:hypothetical protein
MKEAYNLMEGRAVNKDLTTKEGQVYNAWVQMDFKEADNNGNFKLNHFHQNYGYDLKEALSKSPVKELNDPKIINDEGFLNSLKKGNLQSVIIMKNDSSEKIYVDANPQFKAVNVYDSNRQRIDTRLSKDEKQSKSEDKSIRQDNKRQNQAAVDDDGPDIPKEGKKKRKNQSNSM